jgi:hypothetical protein
MSEEALEQPKNALRKELLIWYFEDVLPAFAGKHWFGEDIHRYKLMTDTVLVNKVPKVYVTMTSEAFGWTLWESCEVKWERMFLFKKKHGPKAKFPKAKGEKDVDGKGPDYYAGRYTDSMTGQLALKGITDEGIEAFVKYCQQVKQLREADEANGKAMQRYALKIIRAKHGCTEETPEADAAKASKAKKKRPSKAVAESGPKKIARFDE